MISRLLEVVISVHSGRPDLTVACAACVGRPPAPSALRPRSPSRRCAERSAVVDTSPATHSTSPFAHTRAHDIRSIRAHKHTCTLTHSTLSFFASLCHSARACMDGCTRATPPRSGVETGLPHSPVQPFQPSFVRISNPFSAALFFELSSFFQKLRHPLLSATPCVTSTTR